MGEEVIAVINELSPKNPPEAKMKRERELERLIHSVEQIQKKYIKRYTQMETYKKCELFQSIVKKP